MGHSSIMMNTRHLSGSSKHKKYKHLIQYFVEVSNNINKALIIPNKLNMVELMDTKGTESLKAIRKDKMDRVVIAHLYINSFGNKFESLIEQVRKGQIFS